MFFTPLPGDDAVAIHQTARVRTQPGQKAVIEVPPDNQSSTHYIPTVAISKLPDATYSIEVDGTERFGPDEPMPPTDPDDLAATFLSALEMERSLTVTVKDVRSTGSSREFETHILGWEA